MEPRTTRPEGASSADEQAPALTDRQSGPVAGPGNKAPRQVTVKTIRQQKGSGRRVVMVTAYDTPTARAVDRAGPDIILVGDSLGMVVLGYEDTLKVDMIDMVRHTAAVRRAGG